MDLEKQKLSAATEALNQEKMSLGEKHKQLLTERQDLDQKSKNLEAQQAQYVQNLESFTRAHQKWEAERLASTRSLETDLQGLESAKSAVAQEKTSWEEEKKNHEKAFQHSREELEKNLASLAARETQLNTLREQIQQEWTTLRKSEGELDTTKKQMTQDQQKAEARFMEWEERLKNEEADLKEKQKAVDMKDLQIKRERNQWLPQPDPNAENVLISNDAQGSATVAPVPTSRR